MMHGKVLDLIISPTILLIGIFGNILMLSILLRWIHRYHINFYFCNKHNRPKKLSTRKNRVGSRQDIPINQGSALNFSMCTYLSFLSFTDLVSLMVEFVFTLWRGKCDSLEECDVQNARDCPCPWATINFLISIFNVFKGKHIFLENQILLKSNTNYII